MNVYLFCEFIPTLPLFILLLKLLYLWPLKAPSRWVLCPSTCSHHILSMSFPPGTQDAPGSSCIFPVPILKPIMSPRIFFILENHI